MRKITLLLLLPFLCHTTSAADAQQKNKPDEQMQAVLEELASLGGKPIESLSATEARKQPGPTDAVKRLMEKQGKKQAENLSSVSNQSVKLGDISIPVRIYTPSGRGPFPVVFYIHGGGWVIADLDAYDASARALCSGVGAIVVSTHYRQAPEFKFPASHEDVMGVYEWILKNEGKLNYDSKKIVIAGESAGGNMALGVCLMAKKKGIALPLYQALVYPVADLTDLDSPSYLENATAKPLNKAMMQWFGKQLFNKPEDAETNLLSPARAGDALKGMPPATIINAEIDPLRSDGDKLADALTKAGVQVKHKVYAGVTHEFFGMASVVDKAKEAQEFVIADLRRALSLPAAPDASGKTGAK